jgi:hypothetical protein
VGEDDRVDAIAQVEPGEHVGHVRLESQLADNQLLRDLGVRQATGELVAASEPQRPGRCSMLPRAHQIGTFRP